MPAGQPFPFNTVGLFDLYDFFSMVIPGTTFLIGLYPFLPTNLPINFYSLVILTLLLGYVAGRGIHSAAESADNILDNDSHRDLLADFIKSDEDDDSTSDLIDQFYQEITDDIPIENYPKNRTDATNSLIAIIYVQARSKLQMDGRGRASTFQATFAFYRSTHFVMVALGVIYIAYALAKLNGLIPPGISYHSMIGSFDIYGGWLAAAGESLAGLSWLTFHDAKSDHRGYFVHYLMQEYLLVKSEEKSSALPEYPKMGR